MQNVGMKKADTLADHLSGINPHAAIEHFAQGLAHDIHGKLIPDLSKYSLIIDTTGNDDVLRMLSSTAHWDSTLFFSTSVGLGAKRVYLCATRNHSISVDAYLKTIKPYLENDWKENSTEDFPRDGIGCWHPLFPARSDDMWMAACVSVKILEYFADQLEKESLIAVYESKEEDGFFSGFAPVMTEMNLV